jgi:hypothetical protein
MTTKSVTSMTFLSYSRQDSEFARRLTSDLQATGIAMWVDERDMRAGYWDDSVEEALRRSERLVVLLSPDAVVSKNVKDEVSFAIDEGKTLLPVLYRTCRIPLRLRRFQRFDLRSDYRHGLVKLVAAINAGPEDRQRQWETEAAPPDSASSRGRRRRSASTTLVGSALLAILLALLFKAAFWGQEVTGRLALLFLVVSFLLIIGGRAAAQLLRSRIPRRH